MTLREQAKRSEQYQNNKKFRMKVPTLFLVVFLSFFLTYLWGILNWKKFQKMKKIDKFLKKNEKNERFFVKKLQKMTDFQHFFSCGIFQREKRFHVASFSGKIVSA